MNSALNKIVDPLTIGRFRNLVVFASFAFLTISFAWAKDSIPPFTVEGVVSWERFEPFEKNAVKKVDSSFLFSYSNGVWRIQVTYQNPDNDSLQTTKDMAGSTIDCLRIPGGIREITILSTNAYLPGIDIKKIHPSAVVRSDRFPNMAQQELFLPWLSLCPNPELPMVTSGLIHFDFRPKFLDSPKNEGGFQVNYIEPEKQFLSELTVTNNGIFFQSDGSALEFPDPYNKGYVQFAYKVREVTNYDGITFPLNTVLYQYAPSPTGKSSADIYPALISRLIVKQIDIGGKKLAPTPAPADVVALDSRPIGLNNGVTVNYNVTNDQWYALTNKRMEQLANFFRHQSLNRPQEVNKYSRNRIIILCFFGLLALAPLTVAFLYRKTRTKTRTK